LNQSGDAADQVVRLMIGGAEEAIKISGQAAYHLIALLTSSLKSDKKGRRRKLSAGKTRLLKLLRDGEQLKIFSLRPKDIGTFQRKAKKYKIQYAIVRNKRSGQTDVVARVADVDLINRVMQGMGYGQEASLTREPDARAEAVRADDLKKKDLPQRNASGRTNISSPNQRSATPLETTSDLPDFMRARMRQSLREAPDAHPTNTSRSLSLHAEPDAPPRPGSRTDNPANTAIPPKENKTPDRKPSIRDKMADCQRRAKIQAQSKTHQRSRKKTRKISR